MPSLIFRLMSICAFVLVPFTMAEALTADELRSLLRTHPDIILEVLDAYPEEILRIAQEGAIRKRDKAQWEAWQWDLKTPKHLNTRDRLMRGNVSAPVTIVAFSDFTCPHCKRANDVIQTILKKRPEDVRYLFKHFPADEAPVSREAAEYFMAAARQGVEKAWLLYDGLFAENEKLIGNSRTLLSTLASKAGLDVEKLLKDLRGDRGIGKILDADLSEATALDVQGTPVLFVNDLVLRGAPSAEQLNRAVDLALKHSKTKQ